MRKNRASVDAKSDANARGAITKRISPADTKLIPSPPARVDSRNTKESGLLLYSSIKPCTHSHLTVRTHACARAIFDPPLHPKPWIPAYATRPVPPCHTPRSLPPNQQPAKHTHTHTPVALSSAPCRRCGGSSTFAAPGSPPAVSYTHLTLPTICSV
eukprot:3933101-Rhodomonas_salina.3